MAPECAQCSRRKSLLVALVRVRWRGGKVVYETVASEREERRVPNKPSTINRDLRTLRAALKKARPEYGFPGGAFFPTDDTRVRWLRPEEELLVLEPMPSPFREIAKLAALTLMRQGEILSLRPEYVHLEQGVVLLPRAKGGARPSAASLSATRGNRGCSRTRTASHTAASTSRACSARPPARPGFGTFTFTTCAITGRRWRSTQDLPRPL
jgi:integrase